MLASRPADARLLHASKERNFPTRELKISFVIEQSESEDSNAQKLRCQ